MDDGAQGFVMNQTMLRIKDPAASIPFYRDVMGMTLLDRYEFPSGSAWNGVAPEGEPITAA